MSDKVSVIMPAYNAQTFIKQAIESVLNQSYDNIELIIIDDQSTDQTENYVKAFNDSRLIYIKNNTRKGAAKSRNIGIKSAQGVYIAFLDSDDYWVPKKLEIQIEFMKKNNHPLSFTHYIITHEKNNIMHHFKPNKNVTYKDVLKANIIGCSTVVYDSHFFNGIYFPEQQFIREDMAMWLTLLKKSENALCISESLTHYRVHELASSHNKLKMIKQQYNTYKEVTNLKAFSIAYYMLLWAINGLLKRLKYYRS